MLSLTRQSFDFQAGESVSVYHGQIRSRLFFAYAAAFGERLHYSAFFNIGGEYEEI